MPHSNKIPFGTAILINLNVMLGAGIFMNTTYLAQQLGMLGGISYLFIGVLMLPLILSITHLVRLHPNGGFYVYGSQEISPFIGFLGAWGYFIGKLGSVTIMTHTSMLLLQSLIPPLMAFHPLLLDALAITSFILLNLLNVKTGGIIQSIFMFFKLIPIMFTITIGYLFFNHQALDPIHFQWDNLATTFPILLYATLGFEAAAALSSKIKNAEKNAPRVILISYGLVILLASLYQLSFYGTLLEKLVACIDLRMAFPALSHFCFPTYAHVSQAFTYLMYFTIAVSALGGSYGIIFTNTWNLYSLAQHRHTFFPDLLLQANRNHIPWLCVVLQGIFCIGYLILTQGAQIPLQQMGASGCIIAYTVSVLSLLAAKYNNTATSTPWTLPLLGLINCLILIITTIYSFINNSAGSLVIFSFLLLFGIIMYLLTYQTTSKNVKNRVI